MRCVDLAFLWIRPRAIGFRVQVAGLIATMASSQKFSGTSSGSQLTGSALTVTVVAGDD